MITNKSISNNNSFTLKFTNTTNELRKVVLFEQGSSSTFSVKKVRSQVANGSQGTLFLNPIVWNNSTFQPFGYPTFGQSLDIPSNYNVSDFRLRLTQTLKIYLDSLGFPSVIAVSLIQNMTIDEVNQAIRVAIRQLQIPYVLSPSGEFIEIYMFLDQNKLNNEFASNGNIDIQMTNQQYYQSWGVSVEYPNDLNNRINVDYFNFNGNFLNQISNFKTIPQVSTSSANGIVVDDTASNVTYNEIERSQSGGVYDVQSMSLDVGKTPSRNEADGQMLQPLCYKKRDVNGNVLEYCKVPTKDPYQFQDSYSVLEMSGDDDNYVLDGNTEFVYNVEPLTSAILTFNYTKLTNLVADTRLGIEKLKLEQKELNISDAKKGTKRTIELTTKEPNTKIKEISKKPKSKSKPSNFNDFNNNTDIKSPSPKKKIGVLLGISIGLFLLYKLNKPTKI